MRRHRRQIVVRVLEVAGGSLLLLDGLLYFAMLRPAQNWVAGEHRRHEGLRRQIREEQVRLDRLEKFQDALPTAGDKLEAFKRRHVPSRRHGFSSAARLVRRVAEQSGTQLGPIAYRLDKDHHDPLERLGVEINVEGSFSNLLKFAHALETASDFIVLREFAIEPLEGGALGLRMVADLYLSP